MKYIAILILVILLLPLFFKLIRKLRLTVPLIYILIASTVFVQWTEANQRLSMIILFVLLGAVAISWLITLFKYMRDNRQADQYMTSQLYKMVDRQS